MRLIGVGLLLDTISKETCCRSCAEWHLKTQLDEFAAFLATDTSGRPPPELLYSFRHSRSGGGQSLKINIGPLEAVADALMVKLEEAAGRVAVTRPRQDEHVSAL